MMKSCSVPSTTLPATSRRAACVVIHLALAVAMALTASPLLAQSALQSGQLRPITADDISGLHWVSGLALSPDGEQLVFVQDGAVWILGTAAGGTPRQLVRGFDPIWSPSGRRLAYYAMAGEPSAVQVFVVEVGSGTATQVTHLDGGVLPDRLAWSSGDILAFVADVPLENEANDRPAPEPASAERGVPLVLGPDSPDGYALQGIVKGVAAPLRIPTSATELFVHDLTTGETRQLTEDGLGYRRPAWSPDGRTIAVGSHEGFHAGTFVSGVYLVDPATGRSRTVASGPMRNTDPSWAPDGRHLAYAMYSRTDLRASGIAVVTVDDTGRVGDPIHLVTTAVNDYVWSADGASLYVTYVDGATRPLRQVEVSEGVSHIVGSGGYVAGSIAASTSGDVAWTEARGDLPQEIRVLRHSASTSRSIYDPNPQLRDVAIGIQEIVTWRNSRGHERQGIVILPIGFEAGRRYPLIVSAYTEGTHLNSFGATLAPAFGNQLYAALGYVVFFPGPRLPWMYGGAASAESVGGPEGWDLAFDDVESGVDTLIARGLVDTDRMAIMGFSNGGAVAAALMTNTDRYRAAVAVAPANLNWIESALRQDNVQGRWIATNTFVGIEEDVWHDPEAYLRGSLVFRAQEIETPLLLAVGDRDDASFILPTAQLYLALRQQGKDVTLLRYEGMAHGFYGPAADDLNARILAFLEAHVPAERSGM